MLHSSPGEKWISTIFLCPPFHRRALAEQTGCSASFLSQVENGQASPSLSSLERLATALGGLWFSFLSRRRGTKYHCPPQSTCPDESGMVPGRDRIRRLVERGSHLYDSSLNSRWAASVGKRLVLLRMMSALSFIKEKSFSAWTKSSTIWCQVIRRSSQPESIGGGATTHESRWKSLSCGQDPFLKLKAFEVRPCSSGTARPSIAQISNGTSILASSLVESCVSSSRRYIRRPLLRFEPPRGAPVLVIEKDLVSRDDQVFHHAAEVLFRPGQKEEIRANLLPNT